MGQGRLGTCSIRTALLAHSNRDCCASGAVALCNDSGLERMKMAKVLVCPKCGSIRPMETLTCRCGFTETIAPPLEEFRAVRLYRNCYLFYSFFIGVGGL